MKPLVYKKAKRVRHQAPVADAAAHHQGRHGAGDLGRRQGQAGQVLRVYPKTGRVTVEGMNIVKRHLRATQTAEGGIVELRGADPSLEGDADRSQERASRPGSAGGWTPTGRWSGSP